MHKLRYILIIINLFIFCNLYTVNRIDDLSFTNADIKEVLKTLSEVFEITIVPDKDVEGSVTRYFKGTNLSETLILLLEPLGYSYETKENIYFVKKKSPFKVVYNKENKQFLINSNNGSFFEIIDKISLESKETIIFEGDKNDRVSIHIFEKDLSESLNLISSAINYTVKKESNIYYVKKKVEDVNIYDNSTNKDLKKIIIKGAEDKIEIKVYNQPSKDIVLALFNKFQKEIGLFSTNSNIIQVLDISNVTFDNLLDIILSFSNQSFTKDNNKYFIYNSQAQTQSGKYLTIGTYKLKNMNQKNFQNLVPSQMVSPSSYRIDAETNIISVWGSPFEVTNYIEVIKKIDTGRGNFLLRVFKLKFIDVKNIKKYLPIKYQNIELSIIEELNIFSSVLGDDDYEELKNYLEKMDIPNKEYRYKFKYLKPEEVLKSMLPQNINKNQIIYNPNDSSLIFNISDETQNNLFAYFDTIDVAPPVIRYQLLIVEYIHKNTFNFDWGASIKRGTLQDFIGGGNVFGTKEGEDSLLNANFDIPTIFGYYFSLNLSYQLTEEKAKIQMATEVYGISGEQVNLTNTQTLQYKDYQTDSNNVKKPVFGSTTFGLTIDIKGRATSSEEVFLEVSARISDQLPGKQSGEAPDTSEKTIKNSIRTKTGRPIVLGGLTSKKESIKNNKLPGLGDIPYLGEAFKTHKDQFTDSEFVIYIIPFIQKTEDDVKKERAKYVKEMYEKFILKKN
ncbi:MAG TPA: hypothetical protein PK771_03120 [Spirochaetota bacterium]|nr:hypothetical protein [Spirochaetota bacterium]